MPQETYSQQYSGHTTQSPVLFSNTFWSTVAPFAGSRPGQIYWRCSSSIKWIGFAGTIKVLSNFHTLAAWCFNFNECVLLWSCQALPNRVLWLGLEGTSNPIPGLESTRLSFLFLDFGSSALSYANRSVILMLTFLVLGRILDVEKSFDMNGSIIINLYPLYQTDYCDCECWQYTWTIQTHPTAAAPKKIVLVIIQIASMLQYFYLLKSSHKQTCRNHEHTQWNRRPNSEH
jgi:hypothetical protein